MLIYEYGTPCFYIVKHVFDNKPHVVLTVHQQKAETLIQRT